MIVTLGHYQSRVIMSRIPELHATAMAEHREPHGAKMHTYDLPAIAWKQIRDHLYLNPLYYGPLGGKLDSQPHSLYRAIQLIHRAVIEIEHHPAFDGRAVIGAQMRVIPAWQPYLRHFPEIPRRPYPTFDLPTSEGWAFVLLVPEWSELHGQEMTEWRPARETPPQLLSWTWSEKAHIGFLNAKV